MRKQLFVDAFTHYTSQPFYHRQLSVSKYSQSSTDVFGAFVNTASDSDHIQSFSDEIHFYKHKRGKRDW